MDQQLSSKVQVVNSHKDRVLSVFVFLYYMGFCLQMAVDLDVASSAGAHQEGQLTDCNYVKGSM